MNPSIIITRQPASDQGTPGIMVTDDESLKLRTLELPWRDNKPNISCVKPGIYAAVYDWSPHLNRWTYHLSDAQTGHVGIRIHSGNFAGDTAMGWQSNVEGCILFGLTPGALKNASGKDQIAVLRSQQAIARFEDWASKRPITVHIY